MSNQRWRKINQFVAVSATGKKQSAFGTFLADAELNSRENCEIEMDLVVERTQEYNCDKVDLIGEPVKSRYRRFRFTYTNPTAHQAFRMIAYKEGAVTSPVGTPANEVQTLSRSGTVSGGTFTLGFSFEGRAGSSAPIAWNATAADIQKSITNQANQLGKIIHSGDVVASGDWAGGIVLTFAKRLRNTNLPLLTVANTAITGGGSVVNAQTTAGEQNYHTAQRSDDGSKPLVTIATGNKGQSVATRKYGDGVIESVDFSLAENQTDVQMTVVGVFNFNPEEISGFTVPACVNLPAMKTTDSRIEIDSNFEQRDLVSHSISLNDNVPVAAAFAYDDIDMSNAPERGDQPTQEFTSEIFGDATHNLYVLAEDEHIEGNEVPFNTHLGIPGNRVSILSPETKIKPQSQLEGFSGQANQSTIKFTGTPYGITDIPVTYEGFLDQATAFLTT